MLKEVLIVEGKMDTVAVKRALECDTIETGGFALRPDTLRQIQAAYEKRGIIILTDPDGSGERIQIRTVPGNGFVNTLRNVFPMRGRPSYRKRMQRPRTT